MSDREALDEVTVQAMNLAVKTIQTQSTRIAELERQVKEKAEECDRLYRQLNSGMGQAQ
jgi:predicted RNase H-like nuclease (RuvC/YqgF family)